MAHKRASSKASTLALVSFFSQNSRLSRVKGYPFLASKELFSSFFLFFVLFPDPELCEYGQLADEGDVIARHQRQEARHQSGVEHLAEIRKRKEEVLCTKKEVVRYLKSSSVG